MSIVRSRLWNLIPLRSWLWPSRTGGALRGASTRWSNVEHWTRPQARCSLIISVPGRLSGASAQAGC
jgi:hypothetical protein